MGEKIKAWDLKLKLILASNRVGVNVLLLLTASLVGLCVSSGPIRFLAVCIMVLLMEVFILLLFLAAVRQIAAWIMELHQTNWCTVPVEALVEGYETEEIRDVWEGKIYTATAYKARFSYTYKEKTYSGVLRREQAAERDDARREFPIGSKKKIYVSKRKPECISKEQGMGIFGLIFRMPSMLIWIFYAAIMAVFLVASIGVGYTILMDLM